MMILDSGLLFRPPCTSNYRCFVWHTLLYKLLLLISAVWVCWTEFNWKCVEIGYLAAAYYNNREIILVPKYLIEVISGSVECSYL